jgi:hypothetical protein
MKERIVPLLLAAFFLYSCPGDEPGDSKPVDIAVPADLMGLVHAGSRTLIAGDANIKNRFDLLDEIGVTWILDDFSWDRIQRESEKDAPPDNWNWGGDDNFVQNANDRGKKVLGILDYDTEWLHGGRMIYDDGDLADDCFVDNNGYVRKRVKDYLGADTDVGVFNDSCYGRLVVGAAEVEKFCTYAKAVVSRYNGKNGHGKVDAWCIWNEPNLYPRFWTGTMEEFFTLSKEAAKAIRRADPSAVIVAGALNSIASEAWVRGLYSSGAMRDVDFVAYHPYSINATSMATNYQSFLDNSDPSFRKKVWVTEVGHPTAPRNNYGTEIPEERMPQTIVKTVVLLATKAVQKIFWYHLADGVTRNDNDSEDWFGLYQRTPEGGLIPKGKLPDAYKLCAENIPSKTWRASGLPGLNLPETVQSYYFEGNDGKRCLLVWNNSFHSTPTVTIALPGKNHVLYNLGNETWESALDPGNQYTLSRNDSIGEKLLFFTWEQ